MTTRSSRIRFPALAFVAAASALLAACGADGSAAPQPQPQEEPPPVAEEPKATIELTASAATAEVTLSKLISFKIKLTNVGAEKETVNIPRLGRRSLSFRVREGARVQQLERLRFDLDPRTGKIKWQTNEVKDLAPGESVESTVTVVAVQPGAFAFTPQYLRRGEVPIQGEPVNVEVKPDGENTRLGLRMETTHGTMVFALRPEFALTTVESFAALTADGFFDGLKFHRIVPRFMAQGGDPKGTGAGGPGYFIPGEMHKNLLHDRGVLSMARTGIPRIGKDTAGSQFFIMFARRPDLDPGFRGGEGYTTFGKLVEGEETLEKLEAIKVGPSGGGEMSKPLEKVNMTKLTLVTLKDA